LHRNSTKLIVAESIKKRYVIAKVKITLSKLSDYS